MEKYTLESLHNGLVLDDVLPIDGDAFDIEYTPVDAEGKPLKLSQIMQAHTEGKQCDVARVIMHVDNKKRGFIGVMTNIGNTVAVYRIDQKTREILRRGEIQTCTCPTHAALKDEGGEG